MNRSKMFLFLLGCKTWTNYKWSKETGITRATFGNNRKNNGENIRVKTLQNMANACNLKLVQINSWISPNNKTALFRFGESINKPLTRRTYDNQER